MDVERHTAERVDLATLPSGDTITTTVHRYEGARDGPTVYLQAAQHGDEVNGVEVLRRIHDSIDPSEMSGSLVVVPVSNPDAFDRGVGRRGDPVDTLNGNMNRLWPGDQDGTPYEQMAASLWEYAREADAIVDLHGMERYVVPYMLVDHHEPSLELADAFGTGLASHITADGLPDGMLTTHANERGIPSITPELGHAEEIQEDAAEVGVIGVRNVLRHVGVLPGEPVDNGTPIRGYENHVRATESGLFRRNPDVSLGDEVSEGDDLGVVYDPGSLEVVERVEAHTSGLLFHVKGRSMIQEGKALAIVATEEP